MVSCCAEIFGEFLLFFRLWLLPAELGSRLFQQQYLSSECSSIVKTWWICLSCSLAKLSSTSRASIRRFIDSKIHVSPTPPTPPPPPPPPPPCQTGARQPPARRSLAPSPALPPALGARAGARAGGRDPRAGGREGVLKGLASPKADAD